MVLCAYAVEDMDEGRPSTRLIGDTAAVILAGGAGSRIGGDKARKLVGGKMLVDRVADAVRAQVKALGVVGDRAAAAAIGCAGVDDIDLGHSGPLAGIFSGLEWARRIEGISWVLVLPCDVPLLPHDIAGRLRVSVRPDIWAVSAATPGQLEPLISLWSLRLLPLVRSAIADGRGSVRTVLAEGGMGRVVFDEPMAFHNVNTQKDLEIVEAELKTRGM